MKKTIKLKTGDEICKIGQGTWYMGEKPAQYNAEKEALRCGVELGMTLIDTAEMYGMGKSEILIGEAIRNFKREDIFLVSKVLPYNAGQGDLEYSLENSLKRLGTDYLDMYLLHWPGSVPLEETVWCMEQQVKKGKIRSWGVSNFDTDDMKVLLSIDNGKNCAVNQVLYNLSSRGTEYDLLPYLEENGIPLMAYCPLAHTGNGDMFESRAITELAEKYNVTPAQIILNFAVNSDNVFAVPKSSCAEHTRENYEALSFSLSENDIELLNSCYLKPNEKVPLDIL